MMRTWKGALASLAALAVPLLVPSGGVLAAETVEHSIRAGDNLHLIAGYYYRDPRQWRKVWKLNGAAVPRPNQLVPGRVLRVERIAGVTWDIPYEEFRTRVRGK
jgi:nucleoid-associated protein YgaU